MTDPYSVDAAFYDAIHADFRDDVELWLSFAGRTDRPVLEVGCGTGRIAIELANGGHRVTGIDPSDSMLEMARTKAAAANADVSFVLGRPTEVSLDADHFGLVLLPLDVFLYCADGEEQRATLEALRDCLTFNGRLVLDLPGPARSLDPESNSVSMLAFSGETAAGERFDCWHLHEDDLANQRRWLRVTYETVDEAGVVRRRTSEHHLRYVHRFEIEYLLHLAGLVLVDVYGDYDLGPFTSDSERMIVVARRRDG